MKNTQLLLIAFCITTLFSNAQKVGATREVQLVLMDMPNSGEHVQLNFRVKDTDEFFSFDRFSWLDKQLDFYTFHTRYDDLCQDSSLQFSVSLIYTPIEIHNYVRYEAFEATGVFKNTWAITKLRGEYTFNVLSSHVIGDLNKDGILDLAMITQDTASHTGQYLLEVFLTQPNGDRKLIVSSTEAIEPQYPFGKGNYSPSLGHTNLSIKRGVLWLETGFIRGHMEHKFRYQNGRFELIGYNYINAHVGQIELIDYNLSTGHRIKKEGRIDSDVYTVIQDTVIRLNPLPDLNEFQPDRHELY